MRILSQFRFQQYQPEFSVSQYTNVQILWEVQLKVTLIRKFILSTSRNPEIHNREIVFCNFDDETTNIFLRVIPDRFLEQNVESDGDENKSSGDDEDSRDNSKKVIKHLYYSII